MKNSIGILDSGLGGYSVYDALVKSIPDASFVFLADQKNAPYGDRTKNSIYECSYECIKWFKEQDITEIIIACNTISSACLEELQSAYPKMKLYGIIDLTASQFSTLKVERIGVIATKATVNTHAYEKEIKRYNSNSKVLELATPYLVPLIESLATSESIEQALQKDLSTLNRETDLLVLGCTHYPLVKSVIEKYYQHPIIDSRKPIIEFVLKNMRIEPGENICYTTGNKKRMEQQIATLFNEEVVVNQIVL